MILKLISKLNLIKLIIIKFVILLPKNVVPESILLVRLDEIGDYVLFRNFIKILKQSDKYKGYKITLLGNPAWQGLAEELDNKYIDNFIWLDKKIFDKNIIYKFKKLREITSKRYKVMISPVYSRDFWFEYSINNYINANDKIGSIGDLSNITSEQKAIADKRYTNLIPAKDEIIFEFYRNKEFFETLLGIKYDFVKPSISLKLRKPTIELTKKYAILFIGASSNTRKWNIHNFVKIADYLKTKYEYQIVLCGGAGDKDNAKVFSKYYCEDYTDLVDKTSLVELLYIIYNCGLMVSNETSAPHLAIALGMTNTFVISNANYYGRFTPYPKEISNMYHVIFHPEFEQYLDNYKNNCNKYSCTSKLNINEISIERVIEKIDTCGIF